MNETNPIRRAAAMAAAAVVIASVAACGGGGAAASITPPPDADATISAKDVAFDRAEVTVPAGEPFELFFRNLDSAPHNVAIYTDPSATKSLFVGETISDAATPYEVPALEPGDYFFRCDIHPTMTGTITAQG